MSSILIVIQSLLIFGLCLFVVYSIVPKLEKIANAIDSIAIKNNKMLRTNLQPNKQDIIRGYRHTHPNATKTDCYRDTGISKPTIAKWWDSKEQ